MIPFDYVAIVLSFIGIVLNAKKNIYCWSFWITSNLAWILYYLSKNEHSSVFFWAVYILFNTYGLVEWSAVKSLNEKKNYGKNYN